MRVQGKAIFNSEELQPVFEMARNNVLLVGLFVTTAFLSLFPNVMTDDESDDRGRFILARNGRCPRGYAKIENTNECHRVITGHCPIGYSRNAEGSCIQIKSCNEGFFRNKKGRCQKNCSKGYFLTEKERCKKIKN